MDRSIQIPVLDQWEMFMIKSRHWNVFGSTCDFFWCFPGGAVRWRATNGAVENPWSWQVPNVPGLFVLKNPTAARFHVFISTDYIENYTDV